MKKINKILLVALLVLTAVFLIGCAAEETPYQKNDSQGYSVSVKYDANGGAFTTNTYSIVDSFSADSGEIALIAPDDEARGNDSFTAVNNGYFLCGWYAERQQLDDGSYVYSDRWDFENDRLTVDSSKQYTSSEPVLTLYAAWVPLFEYEFYSLDSGEKIDSYVFDPTTAEELKVPVWNEESGAVEMFKFPEYEDHTFNAVYYDAEGKEPVKGEVITHKGSIDTETGTAVDHKMSLYIDWNEGEWYRIYTAEQLLENASVSGCYEIMADLDFKDEIWPTSFMYGNFSGTIKGNGHTIKNVTLEQTNNSKTNAGLFGNITEEASFDNISFKNICFTIKAGARMTGTSYGVLAGTISESAKLTKVQLLASKLQIDSSCYFGVDDYSVGKVCGMGDPKTLQKAEVECVAVGDAPETVKITEDGNTVTLEF